MKDFDWTQFSMKIAVKAPIAEIYNAWTTSSKIETWFLSNADFFDSNNNLMPKKDSILKGATYKWQWYLWDGIEEGSILQANGKDFFQFTFAGDCPVTIELEAYDKGTIVTLTQTKIPETDEAKKNIRLGCEKGWSFYLVNLKSIYEGGIDLRNKDPQISKVINF